MKWVLIRHGKTKGNLENRYIGCRTDEPLCAEGAEALRKKQYPPVVRVYVSPMRRCRETADILYPGVEQVIVPDFRECDFGAFENLNYEALNGRQDYQDWIDSGGEMPFPGGESRKAFALRCLEAFEKLQDDDGLTSAAIIAHGGTIMAIMEKYGHPRGGYFDFQVKNGEGYVLSDNGMYQKL